jgi:YVTN family beta-propeller protein
MYFDSYVRRVEPALNSGRFTRLKFEHEIITIHGADCLKSEETLEDRGAPNAQGQVITMVSHHLDCFHPSVPDWFINLAYSQRTPPGVQPLDITKEGEAFLAGLQFSSTTVRIVPVRLEGQPFGMAAGHQSLWVTDYVKNSVARIDPDTLLVKATIPVGGHPGMLSAAGDAVWVSTAQPAQIQRIDPATNTVTDSIALPDKPGPVAATAGAVWVGVPSKGEVLQTERPGGNGFWSVGHSLGSGLHARI